VSGRPTPDARSALSDVLAAHDVRSTIVYGGIREIAEKPFGSVTYALDGAADAVDALIAELQARTTVAELVA
jgi:D-methionine transport system ATP-binding protein